MRLKYLPETGRAVRIRFTYFFPKEALVRTVEPYCLVFHCSTWYVWGWRRMREDFRLFKLNRMTNLAAREPICSMKHQSTSKIQGAFPAGSC